MSPRSLTAVGAPPGTPPRYAPSLDWHAYLYGVLEFDVGTPVRLFGAIAGSPSGLRFQIADSLGFDPRLFPAGGATTSVEEPFGMTGVRLDRFGLVGTIVRGADGGAEVDLTVAAAASFPGVPGLTLEGALVLQQTTPRLALVRLETAGDPLTLTDLVRGVLGGTWAWADSITDQFAFLSGGLYYMKGDPGTSYTYTPAHGKPLVCTPGYHADAKLRIFGEYDFAIDLAVVPATSGGTTTNAVTLTTTLTEPIDLDFVQLDTPSLQISTVAGSSYLRVSTTVTILQTPIAATVAAEYDLTTSAFLGSVDADLGTISLDVFGAGTSFPVQLGVSFTWAQGSFRITRIDGLPRFDADLVKKLVDALNSMKGGCNAIVGDWLDGQITTSLTPGMDGGPTRSGDSMSVPFKLDYRMQVASLSPITATIPLPLSIAVPTSLAGLPEALFLSIGRSVGTITTAIITNPDAYRAMALAAAERAGKQATARFLCRAVENFAKELAEKIIDDAAAIAADTLAAAAEMAAAMTAYALMGFGAVLSGLLAVLDEIKHWFTGGKSDKEKAEDAIRAQGQQIQDALNQVLQAIAEARALLTVRVLNTGVDGSGRFNATWAMADTRKLGDGPTVTYVLTLLQGAPGAAGSPWPGVQPQTLPIDQPSWSLPLDDLPDLADYRMNASVIVVASGVTLLKPKTRGDLQSAIDQLNGVDNDVAHQVAAQLQGQLNQLIAANDAGIRTDPVYATLAVPGVMTLGQSVVGLSTIVKTSAGVG